LPQADYQAALIQAGLPDFVADLLADSDAAAKGALFDDSRQLSTLLGRPTTPLATTIAATLKK
jgi:NAD(P)H dehydrogenase (quinone)